MRNHTLQCLIAHAGITADNAPELNIGSRMHSLVHTITAKPILQFLDRDHWEACLQTWAMHDLVQKQVSSKTDECAGTWMCQGLPVTLCHAIPPEVALQQG